MNKRFQIAHREAWIGIGLALFNFIWWFGFAYGLGGRSMEEYSYIWGLPDWFFYSCIVGFVIMTFLVWLVVALFFKNVSFEEEGDSE
ncbi:YhdT family protein [Domibacillus indicus]|uniref:YhdT family protein n=1 Tax=Domibacillus indicus TaxID=1437523 RepID=UPI000617C129|nr:YhdT family protein [Domibacillus indicus]